MNRLRTFVALLVCISVPLASASAVAVPVHCTPQHSTERTTAPATGNCCDTDQYAAGSPQGAHKTTLCKAGIECKSCATFTMAPARAAESAIAAADPTTTNFQSILSSTRNPAGLWRPPRTV